MMEKVLGLLDRNTAAGKCPSYVSNNEIFVPPFHFYLCIEHKLLFQE